MGKQPGSHGANKTIAFHREGQSWLCTTGLPSDITVEVDEMLFHLHKFPLMSRSGKLFKLVVEATSSSDNDPCSGSSTARYIHRIRLHEMPGSANAFEMVAKFCYGIKIEFSAENITPLRCASEYLQMTEDYGEGNLISLTESFLTDVVWKNLKDSAIALKSCEHLLPEAEKLSIVKNCVTSIAHIACADPSGVAGIGRSDSFDGRCSLQSPDGTLLWNGINTGARPKNLMLGWWYEDVSVLNLPFFKRVIKAMEDKKLRADTIAGALVYYAKKNIPGLNQRHVSATSTTTTTISSTLSEADQVTLLETIESLLPLQEWVVSTKFLCSSLRIAMILNASKTCRANLEKRIGAQLEQAAVDDILIPNFSYSSETLYDVECVQRIMQFFLGLDKAHLQADGECGNEVGTSTPLRLVARLLDEYLSEIASDPNLQPAKFQALAEIMPHYARDLDDGLYRSVDIYIKAHPTIRQDEKEEICNLVDCGKLSMEACTHAAQNERLPVRMIVQVLFMEQMHLREAVFGCLEDGGHRPSLTRVSGLRLSRPGRRSRFKKGMDKKFHGGVHTKSTTEVYWDDDDEEDDHVDIVDDGESFVDERMDGRNADGLSELAEVEAETEALHLHSDMAALKLRLTELEKECGHLRICIKKQVSHHHSNSWTSKLTCRQSAADDIHHSTNLKLPPRYGVGKKVISPAYDFNCIKSKKSYHVGDDNYSSAASSSSPAHSRRHYTLRQLLYRRSPSSFSSGS